MISFWQILIVLLIVVIIFGPSRLEKMGPSLGKALRGFKKGLEGDEEKSNLQSKEDSSTKDEEPKA